MFIDTGLSLGHLTAWQVASLSGSKQERGRESPRWNYHSFCNLISGLTFHHFSFILFSGRRSLGLPPVLKERHEYQETATINGLPYNALIPFSIQLRCQWKISNIFLVLWKHLVLKCSQHWIIKSSWKMSSKR